MLRTLFFEILSDISLFLAGLLAGVALGIIATLVAVTAYMSKDEDD
ncbi:membrane protein [Streptomyces phage Faust]|uniref:Membrane protein n=1 Tax=Streptomyces phage Faust TaxID=2767565 RepID=A0A7G9UYR5_9CAUD|nr:membrane protein [Streptomyces phage Faust]QNN99170.1 membrane protein [Streptomyces phage Faust]